VEAVKSECYRLSSDCSPLEGNNVVHSCFVLMQAAFSDSPAATSKPGHPQKVEVWRVELQSVAVVGTTYPNICNAPW